MGQGLAVFKTRVRNHRDDDQLHGPAGAKMIRYAIEEGARTGRWRRLRAIKYVVSHKRPIGGRHTGNGCFQHWKGEQLFFAVQVECERILTREGGT
jgi:hypothetical protein